MSASGLYLDFTNEETDQTEMPAGGRHGWQPWSEAGPASWRWSSVLCVADASRTEATFVSLTQEGEEGPWGAGVNPPPPRCPDEVICCFFLKD